MGRNTQTDAGKRIGSCPNCGKETQHAYRPFCSRRCADVDLARWLGGGYAIAGGSEDADEDGDAVAARGAQIPGLPEGDDGTD